MATSLKRHVNDKAKCLIRKSFVRNAWTSLSSGFLRLSPCCLWRSMQLSQHSFALCEMTFQKESSPTRQNKCPICHLSTKLKQNGTERKGASCTPSSSENMKIKCVKDCKNGPFTYIISKFGAAIKLNSSQRRKPIYHVFFLHHVLFINSTLFIWA